LNIQPILVKEQDEEVVYETQRQGDPTIVVDGLPEVREVGDEALDTTPAGLD